MIIIIIIIIIITAFIVIIIITIIIIIIITIIIITIIIIIIIIIFTIIIIIIIIIIFNSRRSTLKTDAMFKAWTVIYDDCNLTCNTAPFWLQMLSLISHQWDNKVVFNLESWILKANDWKWAECMTSWLIACWVCFWRYCQSTIKS